MVEVAVVPTDIGPLEVMRDEKRLVVVALVPVAEVKVTPARVELPVTLSVEESVAAPPTLNVPVAVKLARLTLPENSPLP